MRAGGVPPFGDPRIKGCLPPPRGLSQAATPFIALFCRGIHHMLFRRFTTRIQRLLCILVYD